MKKLHNILVPLVAAALLSSAAPIAAAEVYTETFTVADLSAFNAVGWSNYLTKDDSSVVDWAASNTEPSYVSPNDYAFFAPKNDIGFDDADGPGLLFTTEPGPLDVGSLASLSLAENMDGSTGDPASGRFAIRIGGQWYASDFQFTSTTDEGPSAPFSTVTLDGIDFSDGNNWRTLTVTLGGAGTGGITLAGSTVGGTLSGDVTAFGVYAEPGNDGDHFRIDNFTIADTGSAVLPSASLPYRDEVIAKCLLANDYWIANNGGEANPAETNDWDPSAYYTGNQRLAEVLQDTLSSEAAKKASYLNRAVNWSGKYDWERTGTRTHADAHCCGQTYIDLYRLDAQSVRLNGVDGTTGIKPTMDSVLDEGLTTVNDWHWIDAFYMAGPVFAKLDQVIGESEGRDYSAALKTWYLDMRDTKALRYSTADAYEGLWYRDQDSKSAVTENGQPEFWGRGNGWVIGGLVRVMSELGPSHPDYPLFRDDLIAMAEALVPLQQDDGFWRASLADPTDSRWPNPETSATAFITYAIAWGINNGVLDQATYEPVVAKAWNGMVLTALHQDGKLGFVQVEARAPASTTYDHTEDYGVGAYLLAGAEISLLAEESPLTADAGPDQSVADADSDGSEPVTLDASATRDPDNKAVAYEWLEGGIVIATGVQPTVSLALGIHTITLRVSDAGANTWEDQVTITVSIPMDEIYSNSFDNFSGSLGTYADNGWAGYLTASDGSVLDRTNTNTDDVGGTAVGTGILYASPKHFSPASTAAGVESLMFTTGVPTVSISDLQEIKVDRIFDGSSSDPASGRFAIRIGSTWYASDFSWSSTTNVGPGGTWTTNSITSPGFDFTDGNNWRALAVTVGASGTGEITLGSTVVGGTLSGDVTACGVYVEHGNGGDHARIDNFVVSATTTTAALAPMTDATFSSPVNNQRELTSFQRDGGGVVYQPVAIATTSATIANNPGWHLGPSNTTGQPVSPTVAMNDVYVTTHAFNLGNDADFSLNTTVNDGDGQVFYLVEHLGNDDGILIEPLDGGGVIAGWSLTLNSSDYAAITTTAEYDWNDEGNPLAGTTFTLADFTGGTGTLTGVTGLRIDGNNAFDLAQLGVAAIVPPANNFTNWISDPAFGLAPADQDFTDDPDGDGLDNGIEAFFGTDPGVSTQGLTEVAKNGNEVTFTHPNPDTPLSDVSGSYQWSLDLSNWNPDDATVNGTTVDISPSPNDPVANTTTVTCTMAGTIPAQLFARAVATTP